MPPHAWHGSSGLPAQQPTPPRPTLPPSHPSAPHHNRLFLGDRRRPASALPRPSQRPSYHPVRWRLPPSSSVSARKGKPQSPLTPCVEAPAAHRVAVGSPAQLRRGWPQSPERAVSDGVSVNLNEAMTISNLIILCTDLPVRGTAETESGSGGCGLEVRGDRPRDPGPHPPRSPVSESDFLEAHIQLPTD